MAASSMTARVEMLLVRHELTTLLLHDAGLTEFVVSGRLVSTRYGSVEEAEAARRILLALVAAGVEERPSGNIRMTDGGSISNRSLLDKLDKYIEENS